MKKSQFSEAKIVEILALPSQEQSIDEICRQHNISPATFYKWRNKYDGMDTEELKRMKELESDTDAIENARLKKLFADKSLDYDRTAAPILQEAYKLLKKM